MDHSAHLLDISSVSVIGVIASLFMMDLAGSIAHCAAMCGPFVLAQVPVASGAKGASTLMRGALIPYHLGRATTYTFLGAAAGGFGGIAQVSAHGRSVLGIFLGLGAVLFLVQPRPRFNGQGHRPARRTMLGPDGSRFVPLVSRESIG